MNNETPDTHGPAAQRPSSTGPRTDAGKAIASQNARKHDLCSRTLRLTPEERAEYNDMRDRYGRDLQPAGDVEQTLVDEICFNYWRLQQTRDAELGIIDRHPTQLPLIALYIRYRTGYERGYYKALDKLQATQRIRKQEAARSDAPLRSAKSAGAPEAIPADPVRSEIPLAPEEIAETALHLEDQIETHLLENRIRAKQQLPSLEMSARLAARLKQFVSQNPGALPKELIEKLRQAA
jgi:hypothetical protein